MDMVKNGHGTKIQIRSSFTHLVIPWNAKGDVWPNVQAAHSLIE